MSQRISVRRAKIQEDKAKRQMVWAILIAFVGGLAFLFVLMPLIFRFVIGIARSGDPFQVIQQDELPPQQPVLEPLPQDTKEKQLTVKGYTEPKAQVQLIVDNNEQGATTAGEDGVFQFDLSLEEGEHQIFVYAEDEAGNESVESTHYTVTIDTTIPELSVETPEDRAVFTLRREQSLPVRGKVSEEATVFVNSSRVRTDEEGNFSTTIQLGEGENKITLRAEDKAGNQTEEVIRTVEYRP